MRLLYYSIKTFSKAASPCDYISSRILFSHSHVDICYLQISVGPHDCVWAAVAKEGWLTSGDHGQKLPVHLFLLLLNRLGGGKRDEEREVKQRRATAASERDAARQHHTDLLCRAAGPRLIYTGGRRGVCGALHHFDRKGLLVHAGAGAARCSAEAAQHTTTVWFKASAESVQLDHKPESAAHLDVPCGLRLRGLPNRGAGSSSVVKEGGKMEKECPLVFGTSRCVELMHTCLRQTFDPMSDFSLRKHSVGAGGRL